MDLTGTLTLDGENDPNAVFIFQMASTLITASSSNMVLINDAQACNVFWQVGSSATFGTGSSFIGHVFALTSITANTDATFNGQLLALNGAVTLASNTIVNDSCVATVTETETASPAPVPPLETEAASPAPVPPLETEAASPAPVPVTETKTGGTLPRTDNSWILTFIVGIVLITVGVTYLVLRRRRI